MESIPILFFNTILSRYYVFIFFLVYLIACSAHLGLKRALIFAGAGYCIAFLSEYSSIHTGIPYGHYYYIEHTRDTELWIFGVPFMDSLSYVFLAYASYSMALVTVSPLLMVKKAIYLLETKRIRSLFSTRLIGALFFVYLDIIIDPVALRGDRWFLGQIYGYREQGVYFGVPISNFIGWFVVGFLLIYIIQRIDSLLSSQKERDIFSCQYSWRYHIGPALYISVLIFNVVITFFIQEYELGWTGIFILLLPSILFYMMIKARLSSGDINKSLHEHLHDFPQAACLLSEGNVRFPAVR
jgi:putative membrane protein